MICRYNIKSRTLYHILMIDCRVFVNPLNTFYVTSLGDINFYVSVTRNVTFNQKKTRFILGDSFYFGIYGNFVTWAVLLNLFSNILKRIVKDVFSLNHHAEIHETFRCSSTTEAVIAHSLSAIGFNCYFACYVIIIIILLFIYNNTYSSILIILNNVTHDDIGDLSWSQWYVAVMSCHGVVIQRYYLRRSLSTFPRYFFITLHSYEIIFSCIRIGILLL